MRQYEAWFDGACWPNPNGHAASGAIVKLDGLIVFEHAEYIGTENTTNNVAEYCGVIAVLKFALELGQCEMKIYGDSDMVVKQMSGVWRAGTLTRKERNGKSPIKPRRYLLYYHEARRLLDLQLNSQITFTWIPRAENEEADALSTKPLKDRGYREDRSYYSPQRIAARELDEALDRAINKPGHLTQADKPKGLRFERVME